MKPGSSDRTSNYDWDILRGIGGEGQCRSQGCSDVGRGGGSETYYISTNGNTIIYSNSTTEPSQGKATVDGENYPLHRYPLYDSPYIRSDLGSGLIRIQKGDKSLLMDFRDQHNPIRKEI